MPVIRTSDCNVLQGKDSTELADREEYHETSRRDEQKMASTRFFIHSMIPLILVNAIVMGSLQAALRVDYASPIGEEKWKMSGNRLRCGLSLTIPNFGVAYFEQYAAKRPHFLLSKWEQVDKPQSVTVYAKDPIWKPRGASFFITKTLLSPGQYALYMPHEPALKSLTYLSQGFQTNFQYRSAEGFLVTVAITPIRFQKMYSKYQRCLGNLLPFSYASIRTSVLHFDSDRAKLSDEEKNLLLRVVEYVHADPSVTKVKISGYADDSGRKSYNNAISEIRAKAVKKYLIKSGLQKSLIDTTWFGVKDPIASNNTEVGKALNRRVVIEIEKK